MKNCLIIGSVAVVVLFFAGYAFAGDSVSIRVSCSIPAVPGVNAPALLEEEASKVRLAEPAEEKEHPEAENPEPSFATIADEEIDEVKSPEGESSLMLVRTIYPR